MSLKRGNSTKADLETFLPSCSFVGYPDGKTEVQFLRGIESIPVTPAYAALIRSKGLAADNETAEQAADK